MNTLEKLTLLLQYYHNTRGVGHTLLLKEGIINSKASVGVLCVGNDHAFDFLNDPDIKEHSLGSRYGISWKTLSEKNFKGIRKPIAIDNYTMMQILQDSIEYIESGNKEIQRLSERVKYLEEAVQVQTRALIKEEKDGLLTPSLYTVRSEKLFSLGCKLDGGHFHYKDWNYPAGDITTPDEGEWSLFISNLQTYIESAASPIHNN